MSLECYKRFLEELRQQGIKVEKLTMKSIESSLKLYKLVN